jgi:hypothetical protein
VRAPRPLSSAADWIRHELPGRLPRPPGNVDRRLLWGLGAAAGVALVAWALASLLGGDDEPEVETRVVTVAVESDEPEAAPVGPLGFPLVATRNTTRIGGPDPVTDAAAIALATHPRSPTAPPTEAAVLVDADDPYAGIAASVLAGPPLRAPILIGGSGELPVVTADALAKLAPQGGSGPADAAVYRVGDVAAPSGLSSEQVGSGSAAEIAADLEELRTRLFRAPPRHLLVASGEDAAYAMPAAAWAARSGDPVLFSGRDDVPEATLEALARHRGTPIYVLGPPSVISDEAVRELERVSPGVTRIGAEGPVANSVAFARFADSTFGWNINDPGHGLVIANGARPLDAAAAAPLSASGKWGPLLVLDAPGTLPEDLRTFLLDIKPGFEEDPTRAVYNHVWLIGDATAIGARVQAEVDELAELAEVGPGAGGPVGEAPATPAPAQPGRAPAPEAEPQPGQGGSGNRGGRP